jgi:hypothetical protein
MSRNISIIIISIFVGIGIFCISVAAVQAETFQKLSGEDSPFGIFDPYEVFLDRPTFITRVGINDYLKDLGVKWVQAMPREDTDELDIFANAGFNVYSRAISLRTSDCPQKMNARYQENLKNLIKKYKDKVKYWEVDTEEEGYLPFNPGEGWARCPDEYAKFLKLTYGIIKQECPDCKVVFGGLGGPGVRFSENSIQVAFLKSVLAIIGGKYFDAFEFKQTYQKENDYTMLKTRMDAYGRVLFDYGIDINKIPVFVETGMYDGQPETLEIPPLPYQSETQDAAGMLKLHVFGIAHGIDRILWLNLIERGGDQSGKKEIFNFYGLVNNPDNDGQSHKKLSYYAYKKMVEVLDGSDWKNIQTVQEKDGVYIYKFTKQGKSIWVVWNDNPEESKITILGIASNQVKITAAVPRYKSGKDVVDYSAAFKTEIKAVVDGRISVSLGSIPVFIGEY